MKITSRTRETVYVAASACQINRHRVVVADELSDGPKAIKEAFRVWRDEWGQDPQVKLSFDDDLIVFDYVGD